ncbi:AMIN-like domain-containing (lipo)protein [Nocardia pseudovaccinii]|uniref:AMIN-like domain-containing (lipo)protein n=1 Tax=Nocardia pseudovaccinii TaxID=189540 RepID=UPI003D8DEA20
MRNRMVLLVAAVATVLVGCGDGGSSSNTTTTAPTTTGTFTDAPDTAPRDAGPKRGTPSTDAGLTVSGIRIGHHAGFDRVVYELGGAGTPGWIVQYTEQAVQDASGKVVDVAGRSILEVQITGSAYPFDNGVTPYSGPDPATDPSAPVVAGVYRSGVFEGTTQSFIGVNTDRPAFEVSTLTNPTRLVIDIANT